MTSDMILLVVLFELLIFGVSAGHRKGVWVLSGGGVWVLSGGVSGYCLGHFACCQRPIMSKQVRKAKIVLCCSAGALLSTTVCLVVVWGVWRLSGVSGGCLGCLGVV